MAIVIAACAACGVEVRRSVSATKVAAYPNAASYCSMECRRSGLTVACETCGKAFYLNPSEMAHRPGRWCSRFCADAGRKAGERRDCARCGAAFYVYPSELTKAGRVNLYCSRACGNVASAPSRTGVKRSAETRARLSQAKTGVPNLKLRKPPITSICKGCSIPFEVSRNRARADLARFCSTDCWYRYVRVHPEESGTYRGGAASYYGPNWQSQSRKARERDQHTCQDCGVRQYNPRLDVHHLRGRRFFGTDYEAANQLDNLISLCKPCHIIRERVITLEIRAPA